MEGKEVKYSVNFTAIQEAYDGGKKTVILDGSTRSFKTRDSLQWLLYMVSTCLRNTTNFALRETYDICFDNLMTPFMEMCEDWGIRYHKRKQTITIGTNEIRFLGCDKPRKFKGPRSHIVLIDEANEQDEEFYDQINMRNSGLIILTRNPSYVNDYLDNIKKQPDCAYFHSTYKDNPVLATKELSTILSYDPDNSDNVKNGTSDAYLWSVYGLGIAAKRKGAIFSYKEYTDLPPDADLLSYGLDFGANDPTALAKVWHRETSGRPQIYIQQKLYTQQDDEVDIGKVCNFFIDNHIGINDGFTEKDKNSIIKKCKEYACYDEKVPGLSFPELTRWCYDNKITFNNVPIIADSANKMQINYLQDRGFNISPSYKIPILERTSLMKSFDLFVHCDSGDAKMEFNSYIWKKTRLGMSLFKPIDNFNHIIDGVGYVIIQYFCTRAIQNSQ